VTYYVDWSGLVDEWLPHLVTVAVLSVLVPFVALGLLMAWTGRAEGSA
jgi:hypothetical protein